MKKKYHGFTEDDHTFVICAYKESAFLEECIESLEKQNKKSKILLATSTPNDYIKDIARRHGLEVNVNTGDLQETGITHIVLLIQVLLQ
jgi:GT2 family glycosyltransferase